MGTVVCVDYMNTQKVLLDRSLLFFEKEIWLLLFYALAWVYTMWRLSSHVSRRKHQITQTGSNDNCHLVLGSKFGPYVRAITALNHLENSPTSLFEECSPVICRVHWLVTIPSHLAYMGSGNDQHGQWAILTEPRVNFSEVFLILYLLSLQFLQIQFLT